MTDRPVALTIAGSDSGGGAGIQADLKTMEALGTFGTSAITSVTAQNTQGVSAVEDLSATMVAEQIEAVVDDFDVSGAKTGMLSRAEIIRAVIDQYESCEFPLVVDPVMVAQSGDRLLAEAAESVLQSELVPAATVVTPNLPEAAMLADMEVTDPETMAAAGRAIIEQGPDAVLVTGGHLPGEELVDVLVSEEVHRFEKEHVDTNTTHGGGCMISAAIAAELAKGAPITAAVERAEELLARGIKYGLTVGRGYGAVHHLAELRNEAARFDTLAAVRDVVHTFEQADITRLIPEVGLNVSVVTPYAMGPGEVAAIDGRMTRTTTGVAANDGVWFGASSHVARFLLAMRSFNTELSAACNLRLDAEIEAGARSLWDVQEIDRTEEPPTTKGSEGGTMQWSARQAMAERDPANTPDAVIDWGDVGKEPNLRLLATAPTELRKQVLRLDRRLS